MPSIPKKPVALPLPVRYDGMMYYFGKGVRGDEIVADLHMGEEYEDGFRIRGWGRIQYLKEEGKTGEQLQDECAYYIQDAINAYGDITLVDVLMAINKVTSNSSFVLQSNNTLSIFGVDKNKCCNFDLTKPLHLQPEPVIAFLSSVLVK